MTVVYSAPQNSITLSPPNTEVLNSWPLSFTPTKCADEYPWASNTRCWPLQPRSFKTTDTVWIYILLTHSKYQLINATLLIVWHPLEQTTGIPVLNICSLHYIIKTRLKISRMWKVRNIAHLKRKAVEKKRSNPQIPGKRIEDTNKKRASN